jgi:hypothetical protein
MLEAAHAAGVGAGAEEYALRALDASIFDAKQLVAGAPQPEPLVANAGDGSLIRDDPAALGGGNRKRRRAAEKPDDAPPPQTLLAAAAPGKAKKPKAIWDQLLATPGAPEPLPMLPNVPLGLLNRAHDVLDGKRLRDVTSEAADGRILRAACAGSDGERYDVYVELPPEGGVLSGCAPRAAGRFRAARRACLRVRSRACDAA